MYVSCNMSCYTTGGSLVVMLVIMQRRYGPYFVVASITVLCISCCHHYYKNLVKLKGQHRWSRRDRHYWNIFRSGNNYTISLTTHLRQMLSSLPDDNSCVQLQAEIDQLKKQQQLSAVEHKLVNSAQYKALQVWWITWPTW